MYDNNNRNLQATHSIDTMNSTTIHHLILHTRRLQNIGPLPTRPRMAMLQMLAEMVGPEKLLGPIALAEHVDVGEVVEAEVPIGMGQVGEFLAAVAAHVIVVVGLWWCCWGRRRSGSGSGSGRMESILEAWEGGTGP